MERNRSRLFDLIESIVPQPVELQFLPESVGLHVLGFDSMAIISLFSELEEKLGVPLERLQTCLSRACTLGALLDICVMAT